MRTNLILLILLSTLFTSAFADDAVEAVAPGEITFEKAPDIIMQDETLTITKLSKNFTGKDFKIDVDFHFQNNSTEDIERKIAFVLPPILCNEENHSMWQGLNSDDVYQKGFKDFSVVVDGKKINFTQRVTTKLGNQNITSLLQQLHVPLNPCQIKFTKEGKLDPKYAATLASNHLLGANGSPAWSENIYFEWAQVFPARKVLEISHHYTPVNGAMVPSPQTVNEINRFFTDRTPPYTPVWNRDPSILAQSNPELVYKPPVDFSNSPSGVKESRFCIIPSWILYHLTTGAYWNGGIGKFHLVIIDLAGGPVAVNTFYGDKDVVETTISKNRMSFTINHFIPTKDLMVLYLSLPKTSEDLKTCGLS